MMNQMTKNVLLVTGGAAGGAGLTGGIWALLHRRSKKARAAEQAQREQADAELAQRVADYVDKVAPAGDEKTKDIAMILGRQYEPAKVSSAPAAKKAVEIPIQKKQGTAA